METWDLLGHLLRERTHAIPGHQGWEVYANKKIGEQYPEPTEETHAEGWRI